MLKLIIDMAAGALSGATGGKVDLGRAVTQAVSKAVQSPETALKRQDAPAVAAAIREALPAPQAMESLWPQLLRYAISWTGLWMAKNGYATASDVEMIGGALMMIGPPAWRIATTRYARWRAARAAKA